MANQLRITFAGVSVWLVFLRCKHFSHARLEIESISGIRIDKDSDELKNLWTIKY